MKNIMDNVRGRLHPLSVALRELSEIFSRMGFSVAQGPELETEWHTFTGLNIPPDHPARDMQDTFWIKDRKEEVMRTHTTTVTLRMLEKMAKENLLELRTFNPGKVFRNEATDITHEAQFYQIDGFAAAPTGQITLAHLKGTFEQLYKEYLGPDVKVRLRPSFFSFTEPSVEIDCWFQAPGKEGRWLEMSGAGMIHPQVMQNAGLDPEKTQGFAFGGGLERLLMVKYGIPDVRYFHNGDLRFNYAFTESI